MLNGDENLNFLWGISDRANGKCAVERALLKNAKLINYLKKALKTMNKSAVDELIKNRNDKDTCAYIHGFQDAIATIEWFIYEGEHKDEN